MSDINNRPVAVTGYEERRHVAIRKLARVCIELARLRQRKRSPDEKPGKPEPRMEGSA
ncbi:hypothetical protein [Micromonospora sp. NBC_01796]|uniref:hypothetical protein n=1 Tax=Micromonospora sp. NBC_01796 TaxID=2975987 RepID=UPI002DDA00CD|nr:hypothetical protein [Micromonospora sp. NBC_01796]WSA86712.1 hypothetical protein OIE47_03540 [Micromonospora sp. NBC_01796]